VPCRVEVLVESGTADHLADLYSRIYSESRSEAYLLGGTEAYGGTSSYLLATSRNEFDSTSILLLPSVVYNNMQT
jgi:hypothetical protein